MIRIKNVKPRTDYTLLITFTNGEKGVFDVKPYFNKGPVFKEINNPVSFQTVKVSHGTIEWANGADFCPDCVYSETKIIS